MELRAEEISQIIKEQITDYDKKVELSETGVVLSVGDGIARVYGLEKAMALELVEFPGGVLGLVLNLEEDNVGVAIMGDDTGIKEGDMVKRTGKIAQVPVGEAVLGRVVSGVGEPIDGKGPIEGAETRRVEMVAPGVIARKSVHEPCYTGLKAVDAMTPVGRGSASSSSVTARSVKPLLPSMPSWPRKIRMSTASTWPAARKNPRLPRWQRSRKTRRHGVHHHRCRLRLRPGDPAVSWHHTPAAPWANISATKASTP
jgi:hypothetical protein